MELEADDFGDEHAHRLTEHRRFGFDATDTPAEHAEAVDHGGVRVGANERVAVGERLAILGGGEDDLREVLEIDLMADARARRHRAEVAQRGLAPLEELVALAVALELEFGVEEEGGFAAVFIHLHRVVDHEVDRLQRVDLRRVTA